MFFSDNQCYECTLCPAKSGRKDNIRRHVRNLHSDSDDELRLILEKIFDNFEKKKTQLTAKLTEAREEKTEKGAATNTDMITKSMVCLQETNPTNQTNISCEETTKTSNVVRNIATSVIKFVGRPQSQQPQKKEEKRLPQIQVTTIPEEEQETSGSNNTVHVEPKPQNPTLVDTNSVDPIAEIGVNFPSLEPLNFDPFPDITPLPLLNTNTNLTVYRQLLSPYLKKPTDPNNDGLNSTVKEQKDSSNKHLKPSTTTTMIIDRPPKKMIEKYEIYFN